MDYKEQDRFDPEERLPPDYQEFLDLLENDEAYQDWLDSLEEENVF